MKKLNKKRLTEVNAALNRVMQLLDKVGEADPELEMEIFSPAGHIHEAMESVEYMLDNM